MPKRTDIKKVMVIGSGPIVIGQAAEFDYAGTQACLALKEEGYEVILVNSNPATIMTDTHIADKVYMEPLTLEYVAKIIRYERPDAIVPGLGGQTGLNLAVQLAKKGVLQECQVEILGTSFESIEQAEDRELFKELCERLGEPVLPSHIANNMEEGIAAAERIGYPVVLRPAFTLGGTGGGFADDEAQLVELGVERRELLLELPVRDLLVELIVAVHVQRRQRDERAARDQPDLLHVGPPQHMVGPVLPAARDLHHRGIVCPKLLLRQRLQRLAARFDIAVHIVPPILATVPSVYRYYIPRRAFLQEGREEMRSDLAALGHRQAGTGQDL